MWAEECLNPTKCYDTRPTLAMVLPQTRDYTSMSIAYRPSRALNPRSLSPLQVGPTGSWACSLSLSIPRSNPLSPDPSLSRSIPPISLSFPRFHSLSHCLSLSLSLIHTHTQTHSHSLSPSGGPAVYNDGSDDWIVGVLSIGSSPYTLNPALQPLKPKYISLSI